MALDKCNEAVGAAIGRELTKREQGIVSRRASDLKRKIDLANNDPQAVDSVIKQFADEVEMNRALVKRTAALNYTKLSTKEAWRKNSAFAIKNPGVALEGIFRGRVENYAGSKNSTAALMTREVAARSGAFVADLERAGLTDYAFSGEDDRNITRAMHDDRNDIPPDPAKYGKNAVTVAQINNKHIEALRLDQNAEGAFIARNADRLFRRTHDSNKIAKAGDNTWGSAESRAKWTSDVNDRMNWDKAFDGEYKDEPEAKRQELLDQLHSNFVSEIHLKSGTQPPIGLGTKNYGKKLSHQRELVFNTPDDDLDYQKSYGAGNSVSENILNNLRGGGRDVALMRDWGPNPKATAQKFISNWQKALEKAPDKVRVAFNKAAEREMENTWNLFEGGSNGHPAKNNLTRWFNAVNSTISTAAMGMASFSLPTDMALRASDLAQMTGDGVARSLAKQIGGMTIGSGLSRVEQAALFAEHGIRIEGAHLPLDPDMVDHAGFGAVVKYNRLMMRLTPHAFWDNRLRTNSLVADGYRYWSLRDKAFGELDAPVRDVLSQFGINDKGWDVIRQSEGSQLGNNMRVFQPVDIQSMPLENFKALVDSDTPSDSQLSRARTELFESYRNLLGEKADRSVTAPSIANRAAVGLGYKTFAPNTVAGELYRGFLQLKGWVFNYMRNHLDRELRGYNTDYRTVGQAIVDMVRVWDKENFQPRALSGLSRLIAAGVPIALAANSLRDLATGKTPQSVFEPDAWKRAFARQSLGIYTDFLLEDVRPDADIWDRLGHMAGPTGGAFADAADALLKINAQLQSADGVTPEKLGSDEREWFQMIYRRVPGTQLAWNKFAMDYMVLNNLSEMMNPGYQQRLIDRAQKNRGQTYIFGAGPQTAQ